MPVLAYCVSFPLNLPADEVGADIRWFDSDGLRCYYAEVAPLANETVIASTALQFHRVNTAMFRQVTILPFRFPAISDTLDELKNLLSRQAANLAGALHRLQGVAQMEINIHADPHAEEELASSGTAYLHRAQLRQKQADEVGKQISSAAGPYAINWKQQARGESLRFFALVERGAEQQFSQAISALTMPKGVECRVTGPWPPTEFIEE